MKQGPFSQTLETFAGLLVLLWFLFHFFAVPAFGLSFGVRLGIGVVRLFLP